MLFPEIKVGISKAVKASIAQIWGLGIDTWGVDFGLLDGDGKLIENPYHYRDKRTNGMMEKSFEMIPKREFYELSGLQFIQISSVFQLLAMRLANSVALAKAKNLMFASDLFSYYLCGKVFAEYSIASTSQLMDMRTGQWSKEIFDRLSLPIDVMPDIVQPGTILGQLNSRIGVELGCGPIPVIATAAHDTAAAVAAVPADGDNWAYISSGTWSLMGVETPGVVITDKSFEYSLTNEGGVENTIRLLKNVMGLWLVQECKRQWESDGVELSYTEITDMARKAEPFAGYINPDDNRFFAPNEMPKRVNDYLAETGQKPTEDKGQLVRIILESLALKYRWVFESLEDATGKSIDCLHIVGCGAQNELLSQLTANAIGRKVIAGPVEATAIGNLLMQAKATGQIKSLAEGRAIVRKSFKLKEYQPEDGERWEEQYKKVVSRIQ